MAKKWVKPAWSLLILIILINIAVAPAAALPHSNNADEHVQALIPLSRTMVDDAIAILSGGLAGMTPDERALFNQLYDPGSTGDVDEEFVADVLANYKRIRARLDAPLTALPAADSGRCQGQRLYYTDLVRIYVCPYFNVEESTERKARVLIHEAAHLSLLVVDRPYFHKNTYSTRYRALSPRGPWTASLPLVGPLFREINHSDTLFHPDAYAWFAVEVTATSTANWQLATSSGDTGHKQ
jgi:hypothetical protein